MPDLKPGDLVRIAKPGDGDGPIEDNSTFTVTSIKDGIAYWDEGYAPMNELAVEAEYTDLESQRI